MAADCGCDDWKKGTAVINSALAFCENHGFAPYSGKPYVFCPWCGTKILGKGGVATSDLAPTPEVPEK